MQALINKLATAVMGLGMLVATGCTGAMIPTQPAAGIVQNYPSRSPIVNTLPLTTQAGTRSTTKKLNVYADGMVALTGLPWFSQGNDRTCAQANIASVMNYWGVQASYPQVVKEMNPMNLPTDVANITTYLRNKGFTAQDYRKASINFLKQQVNNGRPTIVLIDFGDLASQHYVTVKGYNDKTGDILYNDPVEGGNMLLDYASFEKMWQNKSLAGIGFGDKYAQIAFDVAVK
jgi:predicted double-glycine peptidase